MDKQTPEDRMQLAFESFLVECEEQSETYNCSKEALESNRTLAIRDIKRTSGTLISFLLVKCKNNRVTSLSINCSVKSMFRGEPAITIARPTDGWIGFPMPLTYPFDQDGNLKQVGDEPAPTIHDMAVGAIEKTLSPQSAIPEAQLRAYDTISEVLVLCEDQVKTHNEGPQKPHGSLVIRNITRSAAGIQTFWLMTSSGAIPVLVSLVGACYVEVSTPRTQSSGPKGRFAVATDGTLRKVIDAKPFAIEHIAGDVVIPSNFGMGIIKLSSDDSVFTTEHIADLALAAALGK